MNSLDGPLAYWKYFLKVYSIFDWTFYILLIVGINGQQQTKNVDRVGVTGENIILLKNIITVTSLPGGSTKAKLTFNFSLKHRISYHSQWPITGLICGKTRLYLVYANGSWNLRWGKLHILKFDIFHRSSCRIYAARVRIN
jgi:hypothetical protein